ncbi:MAG: methyl-accepting chemotaxis protein [Candidatus Korobacteraceae bacterium]
MNLLSRLRIAQKLRLAFGSGLALSVLLGCFSLFQLSAVNRKADLLANRYLTSMRLLATLNTRLNTKRRVELREIAAGADKKEFHAEQSRVKALDADCREAQKEYETYLDNPQQRELYRQFKDKLDFYQAMNEQTNQLQEEGKVAEAEAMSLNRGKPAFIDVSGALDAAIAANNSQGIAFAKAAAQTYANAKLAILLVLGLALTFGLITATVITRNITEPLQRAAQVLAKVAKGDLTDHLEIASQDELGELAESLNHTMEALGSTLTTVWESARQVAGSCEEISQRTRDSFESAQRGAGQTAQAAAAMDQITSSFALVRDHAQLAAEAAGQASETARNGGRLVSETLATMRSIAASTGAVADRIKGLGKSSERIGTIAAVIDDIADQTNLLALNAAIEAARAGEQGRGFAVVADEVRKLADRTAKATAEIAVMIESIQSDARQAVAAMQGESSEVEHGVANTEGSGRALDEMIEMAAKVGEMVEQIAQATDEQKIAAGHVNEHISKIAGMASHSTANADEIAQACTELAGLASNMQALAGRFQLPPSGAERAADGSRHNPPPALFPNGPSFGSPDRKRLQ